jgi:hypothetical protein
VKLIVDVVPLAQPRGREIVFLGPGSEGALAASPLAPVGRPQVQVARELGARVGKYLMLAPRGVGIHTLIARIDDA